MKKTDKQVTLDDLAKEVFPEGVNVKGQVRVEEKVEKRKKAKGKKTSSRRKQLNSESERLVRSD